MPAFHRSFNPYSSVPPPPASLPDYVIDTSTIQSLTNEEAGSLIDKFLQTQDGKVLTLHRLADHLLGRKQLEQDTDDIEELGHVLEEERRREGGVVHVQPDDTLDEEITEQNPEEDNRVPTIQTDKKKARKEERRLKKERNREKRKQEENQMEIEEEQTPPKKSRKDKENKSKRKGRN